MAETGAVYTLTTPGVDITFNSGTDIYRILDIVGLDQAPIRAPVDDSPQTDGGIIHSFYYGPRHFTVEGVLLPGDATPTTRNTMEANLISSLEAILRADGTWAWTPTGQSARSLTVRCDVPVQYAPYQGHRYVKAFIFGLVAADPTW
jgi:hypothetical protein